MQSHNQPETLTRLKTLSITPTPSLAKYLTIRYTIVPAHVDKMRAKLADLNQCAVPFLSHVAANLRLCYYTNSVIIIKCEISTIHSIYNLYKLQYNYIIIVYVHSIQGAVFMHSCLFKSIRKKFTFGFLKLIYTDSKSLNGSLQITNILDRLLATA